MKTHIDAVHKGKFYRDKLRTYAWMADREMARIKTHLAAGQESMTRLERQWRTQLGANAYKRLAYWETRRVQ